MRTHQLAALATATALVLALVPAVCPVFAQSEALPSAVAWTNGYWWNGESFDYGDRVTVDGVFVDTGVTADAIDIVDLNGSYVIPPLADAHAHWLSDGQNVEEQTYMLASKGILYLKNPNNTVVLTREIRERVKEAGIIEVAYANGGFTSPGGHPSQIYTDVTKEYGLDAQGIGFNAVSSESDLMEAWPRFLDDDPDFVKLYLEMSEYHDERVGNENFVGKYGLDPKLAPLVVQLAHAAGLSVSAHVTSRHDFQVAVESGVDEITHLPLERLEADDVKAMVDARIRLITTTLSHRPGGGDEKKEIHRHNLTLLRAAGAQLALGVDAHTTVRDELANIVEMNVFNADELLNMLTSIATHAIFPERKLGRLVPGYEASFVVTAGNPMEDWTILDHIERIVKNGQPLHLQEPAASPEKPGIAQTLMPELMSSGVDAAIARYNQLRETQPDAYDFGEPQLNALAYGAMNHGQNETAVRLFEFNAELFPDSANVYDSLAEGYLAVDRTADAVDCYRKVLENLDKTHYDADFDKQLRDRATAALQAGKAP